MVTDIQIAEILLWVIDFSLFGSHFSQYSMLSNTCFVKKSIVSTFSDFKDCFLDGFRYMISKRLSITLDTVGRSHCSW